MIGKILYNDDKFTIVLPNVKLFSMKHADETLYCKFKLTSYLEKFVVDMEDQLVGLIVQNTGQWFKAKMNQETMEEYFQSSLTVNKKHRCLLKLRIESPTQVPAQDLVGSNVDVTLRIHSVRFLKTSFWIVYDMMSCVPAIGTSFQSDDDDACSITNIDEVEDMGPDQEEREQLRQLYIGKLQDKIDNTEELLKQLVYQKQQLVSGSFSLSAFDAIENLLG